ncbi:MAG: hypothetical protein FWH20_03040, partial [Oscillospiraceae bacterium]|nr:hypothetical protein [Oscillospiraceae bacterium]
MIDSNQYPVFDENPAIGDDPVDCFVHDQDEHYDENDYKGDEIIPKAPAKITRVEICDWVESLIATTTAVFLLMTFAVR